MCGWPSPRPPPQGDSGSGQLTALTSKMHTLKYITAHSEQPDDSRNALQVRQSSPLVYSGAELAGPLPHSVCLSTTPVKAPLQGWRPKAQGQWTSWRELRALRFKESVNLREEKAASVLPARLPLSGQTKERQGPRRLSAASTGRQMSSERRFPGKVTSKGAPAGCGRVEGGSREEGAQADPWALALRARGAGKGLALGKDLTPL